MTKPPKLRPSPRFSLASLLLLLGTTLLLQPTHSFSLDIPRPKAEKKIVRITEAGAIPSELILTKHDSSVFIFNEFSDTPLDLALSFGKNRIHCHSNKLKLDEAGVLRTTNPIPPKSFVVTCFPDTGRYKYTLRTPSKNKKVQISGSIVVKPAEDEIPQ